MVQFHSGSTRKYRKYQKDLGHLSHMKEQIMNYVQMTGTIHHLNPSALSISLQDQRVIFTTPWMTSAQVTLYPICIHPRIQQKFPSPSGPLICASRLWVQRAAEEKSTDLIGAGWTLIGLQVVPKCKYPKGL